MDNLSDEFFRVKKHEDWFRDRYDPSRLVEQEQNVKEWALKESLTFKSYFKDHVEEVLAAVDLDPLPPTRDHRGNESPDASKIAPQAVISKHLPGHEQRTVYLAGIPESCTKNQLRSAVLAALANPLTNRYDLDNAVNQSSLEPDVVIAAPERILVSQPTWSSRLSPQFERNAWLVMPTVNDALNAVKALKYLIVSIRASETLSSSPEGEIVFEFTLNATIHRPRAGPVLPSFVSHQARIETDTAAALEIARLVDEERDIPADSRLEAILSVDPEALKAKPTSTLDLTIAYLRRVHFIAFYGGKRCRDEAHLLAVSSSVVHRTSPFLPESSQPLTSVTDAPEVSEEFPTVSGDAEEVEGPSKSSPRIDRRIESMLEDLRNKKFVEISAHNRQDAQTLLARQERVRQIHFTQSLIPYVIIDI